MGGCATKPKVLKGEEDLTPEPAPTSSESAVVATTTKEGSEAKEGVHVITEEEANGITHEEDDKIQPGNDKVVEESGDVVKVDDGVSKPRSLGNLFKEGEQEKESSGNGNETTQTVNLPLEFVKLEEIPDVETTTATTAPPTAAAFESSTGTADLQTGQTDNQSKQQNGSSGIGETPQKTEVTSTTAAPPVGLLASIPSADELESSSVFEDAPSDETPITAADVVQTGKAEKYEKEVERVAANAQDVNVIEKAERNDQIQDNHTVLTGGSSSAAAEVTGSK